MDNARLMRACEGTGSGFFSLLCVVFTDIEVIRLRSTPHLVRIPRPEGEIPSIFLLPDPFGDDTMESVGHYHLGGRKPTFLEFMSLLHPPVHDHPVIWIDGCAVIRPALLYGYLSSGRRTWGIGAFSFVFGEVHPYERIPCHCKDGKRNTYSQRRGVVHLCPRATQ